MDNRNQRGQILIESLFLVFSIMTLLILFQLMIDQQKNEISRFRLSKFKKDTIYVPKNEDLSTK